MSKSIGKVLNDFGVNVVADLTEKLDQDNSNASGALRQSIDYNVQIYSRGIRFSLTLDDYYVFVDKGRRPGKQPPTSMLEQWITDKGIKVSKYNRTGTSRLKSKQSTTALKPKAPKSKALSKAGKSSGPNILKLRKQMAYLMARGIGRKGIKGTGFYSETVTDKRISRLVKDIEDAAVKDIDVLINKTFA